MQFTDVDTADVGQLYDITRKSDTSYDVLCYIAKTKPNSFVCDHPNADNAIFQHALCKQPFDITLQLAILGRPIASVSVIRQIAENTFLREGYIPIGVGAGRLCVLSLLAEHENTDDETLVQLVDYLLSFALVPWTRPDNFRPNAQLESVAWDVREKRNAGIWFTLADLAISLYKKQPSRTQQHPALAALRRCRHSYIRECGAGSVRKPTAEMLKSDLDAELNQQRRER